MMKMGAMGYLTKNATTDELFAAIFAVTAGSKYICKEIKDTITIQQITGDNPDGSESLSEREFEIAKMVARGLTSREIANDLRLSTKTVEVHRSRILKKLKVKNTPGLINYINSYKSSPGVQKKFTRKARVVRKKPLL